jgi:O-antigen/teichoic acid export membrane protein
LGARYLVAQITTMGMFQSQPFIISQILGPSAVGVFGVTQRLLSVPLMLVQSLAVAHVAAYAHAFSNRELAWLKRTLTRSTGIAGLLAAVSALAIGLAARPVIRIWAGPSLVPDPWLLLWLGLYVTIASLVTPASSLLYATERVGKQALYGLANALLTVSLGVFFTLRWGLPGLGGAMLVAIVLVNPLAQWRELRAAGILDAKEANA